MCLCIPMFKWCCIGRRRALSIASESRSLGSIEESLHRWSNRKLWRLSNHSVYPGSIIPQKIPAHYIFPLILWYFPSVVPNKFNIKEKGLDWVWVWVFQSSICCSFSYRQPLAAMIFIAFGCVLPSWLIETLSGLNFPNAFTWLLLPKPFNGYS